MAWESLFKNLEFSLWGPLSQTYMRNGQSAHVTNVPVKRKRNCQNELNNRKFYSSSEFTSFEKS